MIVNLIVSNEKSIKIHCRCTPDYKKNSGIEENIPLTRDIPKQIRDHVFIHFIEANKVGKSQLCCTRKVAGSSPTRNIFDL